MKSKDIKDILNERPNAVFMAHPTRRAIHGGRAVIARFTQEKGKLPYIAVRYINRDGTLGFLHRHEARDIRSVTDDNYQGDIK